MRMRFLILCLFAIFTQPVAAQTGDNLQQSLAELHDTDDFGPTSKNELDAFYALRGYRPAWNLADQQALVKTTSFFSSIETLIDFHGLQKTSYNLPLLRRLAASASEDDKEKLEFLITASLLHLAHDLHGDSVNLTKLYTGWNFKRSPIDVPAQINAAINQNTIGQYFDQLPPQAQMYNDLARALGTYTDFETNGGWKSIAAGRALQPHDRDARVAQLRARLEAEGYGSTPLQAGVDFFDDALSKVLILYQDRNGLSPDGHLGPRTLEALNTPLSTRLAQIRANMERWRHMPEDFPGPRYTVVNIPDFSVMIAEDQKLVYRGIVIDGKPDRQTPFINSKIVTTLINPSWHVPISIARKDILPKLQKDRHYLEKADFVIADRTQDPTGLTVDWKNMRPEDFNFKLRQHPGDLNSLGQIKFNFDNPFEVYMHGTPHQELFGKAERDFSSGCVRLEDPVRVAEILLSQNKLPAKDGGGPWDAKRITQMIDTDNTMLIELKEPMPIYFVYWSVFSDDSGQINFRNDIYGYDALLTDNMKS